MVAPRVASLLLGGFLMALLACGPTDGPEPIAFDRTRCAHCRMLISDPSFAAQLRTEDGETLDFDDPGCLLRYREERAPRVRNAWFHHLREERWLSQAEVAFVDVPQSPMSYGLGAVGAGEPGSFPSSRALSLASARAAARAEQPHAPR